MSRSALFLAAAFLSACTGPAGLSDDRSRYSADSVPVAPNQPVGPAAVATLAGHWRIAGIDGQALDEPYGIALTADSREIWWEPRCAGVGWTYRIDGHRLAVGPIEAEKPRAGPTTVEDPASVPDICTIGLPERLADVGAALLAARRIRRTASNGIMIEGDGRSLLLFSQ